MPTLERTRRRVSGSASDALFEPGRHLPGHMRGERVGQVAFGLPLARLGKNIGYAMVPIERAQLGTDSKSRSRGDQRHAVVVEMPFHRPQEGDPKQQARDRALTERDQRPRRRPPASTPRGHADKGGHRRPQDLTLSHSRAYRKPTLRWAGLPRLVRCGRLEPAVLRRSLRALGSVRSGDSGDARGPGSSGVQLASRIDAARIGPRWRCLRMECCVASSRIRYEHRVRCSLGELRGRPRGQGRLLGRAVRTP